MPTPPPLRKLAHCSAPLWPAGIAPERLASRIRTKHEPGAKIALLGLPDDLGVRLNNGRPGAAAGPRAFREALAKYGVAEPHGWAWPAIFDAGDVIPATGNDEKALHETHRRITDTARALLEVGLFPIAIGGGHDLTFPFVRAVVEHDAAQGKKTPLAGIYFDAHLDVRDSVGSGMAFRQLVTACGVRKLFARGINPYAATKSHTEWFQSHGGRILAGSKAPVTDTTYGSDATGTTGEADGFPFGDFFLSFDLDVLDASVAPGVSAINPAGWTVREAEPWLHAAGRTEFGRRDGGIRCLDFMELNPSHDDGRTARAAVHLFLAFLRGVAASGR